MSNNTLSEAWSLKNTDKSLANISHFISSLSTSIPLTSLLRRMLMDTIFKRIMNKYGDNGSPCLTPLPTSKWAVVKSLFITVLEISFVKGLYPASHRPTKVKAGRSLIQEVTIDWVKGFLEVYITNMPLILYLFVKCKDIIHSCDGIKDRSTFNIGILIKIY